MDSHEIIDLSLSTDEDEHRVLASSLQNKSSRPLSLYSGFADLSDIDDEELPAPLPRPTPRASESSKGKDLLGAEENCDAIMLASSPPTHAPNPATFRRLLGSSLSPELDVGAPASDDTCERALPKSRLSDRTTNFLSSITENVNRPRKRSALGSKRKADELPVRNQSLGEDRQLSRSASVVPVSNTSDKAPRAKKVRLTSAERELKEQERQATILQKAKAKEAEKERKRQEKEEKAREKDIAAVLAGANKSKNDKKASTPEMIVDLPFTIDGKSVETQIIEYLKALQVRTTQYYSPIPNVIKWRRKVTSRYNNELRHWEPVPEYVQVEKHVMCLLSAKEFVTLASASSPCEEDLERHVARLRSAFEGCIPIYLIEGLDALTRKAKNTQNRAYQAAFRGQIDDANEIERTGNSSATVSGSKRKKADEKKIDEEQVEDALLRLQVIQGCLVHHTAASVETAEWVASFTQHISTIPYKSELPLPFAGSANVAQKATCEPRRLILYGCWAGQNR